MNSIYTVGDLRRAIKELEDLPDEQLVLTTVKGQQSGYWNLEATLYLADNKCDFPRIELHHPQLQNLPMSNTNVWVERDYD